MIKLWQFFAGLGIFLLAMHWLEHGLKNLTGSRLTDFIGRFTDSPIKGVLAGTVATAILQSSSLVTLVLMAFVGAGVLNLTNSLGVIYGSNLGTTLTGWIVTVIGFKIDLKVLAYPLTGLGALGFTLFYRRSFWSSLFLCLTCFGLLFVGLQYMKEAMTFVAGNYSIPDESGLSKYDFFVLGLALTAMIQSSSATMLIVLTALNSQVIQLPHAAAIIIGADLGTTVTALVAGLGGSIARKQTALAHFIFNLGTDCLALLLLSPLLSFTVWVLGGAEPLLSLVLFHSFFNLIGILFFLPFTRQFAKGLEALTNPSSHR